MADASDLVEAVLEAAGPSISETLDRSHGINADHALDDLMDDELDSDADVGPQSPPSSGLCLCRRRAKTRSMAFTVDQRHLTAARTNFSAFTWTIL